MYKTMKKILTILAVLFTVALVSCEPKTVPPTIEDNFDYYNTDSVIGSDLAIMHNIYGDSVAFFETQFFYKYNFNTNCPDSNGVVKLVNVFQYKEFTTQLYHFIDSAEINGLVEYANKIPVPHTYSIDTNSNDYLFILTVKSPWVEDVVMCMDSVNISLDGAYRIMCSLEQVLPESNFAVMRQPLMNPQPTHPYYIFGIVGNYIIIDSKTGKVLNEF